MKVYCKNCKHDRSMYGVEYTTCHPIKGQRSIVVREDYYSPDHKMMALESLPKVYRMEELNKNNDCPHYKRKWWKLWINEECAEAGEHQ